MCTLVKLMIQESVINMVMTRQNNFNNKNIKIMI